MPTAPPRDLTFTHRGLTLLLDGEDEPETEDEFGAGCTCITPETADPTCDTHGDYPTA